MGSDERGLWKEVLESKYEGWRTLRNQRINRSESLWWRDLKEIWRIEGWKGSFEDNCFWEVGMGEKLSYGRINSLVVRHLKISF